MARQLLLEGEIISGKRAYEIGFANYLAEDVLDESLKFAEKLNGNSVESVRSIKQMIKTISNLSVQEAVNHCIGLNTISRSTTDFQKGIDSFLNRDK